ncbi:class I SAM-dependent methyltransferase [Candidatus Undinarchaeota archaeon]
MSNQKTPGSVWGEKHYNVETPHDYDTEPAPFVRASIDFLKGRKVEKILDGGCGQGRNLLYLLQNGFEAVGVDASDNALDVCRKLLKENGFKDAKTIQGELQNLKDLKDNSFDAIISVTVLTHIFDPYHVLKEFHRILKPGGVVIADFGTIKDSTYDEVAKGKVRLGKHLYLEKGTNVKYVESEEEVRVLFWDFKVLEIEEISFMEKGHPGSRPKPHEHTSFLVTAEKRRKGKKSYIL